MTLPLTPQVPHGVTRLLRLSVLRPDGILEEKLPFAAASGFLFPSPAVSGFLPPNCFRFLPPHTHTPPTVSGFLFRVSLPNCFRVSLPGLTPQAFPGFSSIELVCDIFGNIVSTFLFGKKKNPTQSNKDLRNGRRRELYTFCHTHGLFLEPQAAGFSALCGRGCVLGGKDLGHHLFT